MAALFPMFMMPTAETITLHRLPLHITLAAARPFPTIMQAISYACRKSTRAAPEKARYHSGVQLRPVHARKHVHAQWARNFTYEYDAFDRIIVKNGSASGKQSFLRPAQRRPLVSVIDVDGTVMGEKVMMASTGKHRPPSMASRPDTTTADRQSSPDPLWSRSPAAGNGHMNITLYSKALQEKP